MNSFITTYVYWGDRVHRIEVPEYSIQSPIPNSRKYASTPWTERRDGTPLFIDGGYNRNITEVFPNDQFDQKITYNRCPLDHYIDGPRDGGIMYIEKPTVPMERYKVTNLFPRTNGPIIPDNEYSDWMICL